MFDRRREREGKSSCRAVNSNFIGSYIYDNVISNWNIHNIDSEISFGFSCACVGEESEKA